MEKLAPCPSCGSQYTYPLDALLVCPDCGLEWNPKDEVASEEVGLQVKIPTVRFYPMGIQ